MTTRIVVIHDLVRPVPSASLVVRTGDETVLRKNMLAGGLNSSCVHMLRIAWMTFI
jgi:hypothetical protein